MYRNYIKDDELIKKLEELHNKKYRLKELIDKSQKKTPFIVELAGMARTGKTVSTERIFEFFKMANYKVLRTKEPAQIVKERYDITKLSNVDFNDKTLEISIEQLEECISREPDIILQDRGVFDNYIWYQMMYENGDIDFNTYVDKMSNMNEVLKGDDQLYLMTADPNVIVKRDYQDQIFLEPRKKTTIESVSKLREGMENLLIRVDSDNIFKIDTTNMTEADTAIKLSNGIIDGMTKKLINKNM